jgi:hypothetical protein
VIIIIIVANQNSESLEPFKRSLTLLNILVVIVVESFNDFLCLKKSCRENRSGEKGSLYCGSYADSFHEVFGCL